MNVLEVLKDFKCGNKDFDDGFNFAIKIIMKLNDQENKEIESLKQDIAKLQLKIASLESYTLTYTNTKRFDEYVYKPIITCSND